MNEEELTKQALEAKISQLAAHELKAFTQQDDKAEKGFAGKLIEKAVDNLQVRS